MEITRRRSPGASLLILGLIFISAGTLHFVVPEVYTAIVPPWLPAPMALVYLSGVAEVLGGLGLLIPRTRKLAGIGLMILLLAVWPANIQMWVDARAGSAGAIEQLLLLVRILLQVVLIWWVWRASVRPRSAGPSSST